MVIEQTQFENWSILGADGHIQPTYEYVHCPWTCVLDINIVEYSIVDVVQFSGLQCSVVY